jgi:predicted transcriptional regulator
MHPEAEHPVARRPSKNLTERELEIMQILWDRGEARLGDIQDALNQQGEPVAPSTVATQLSLLVHKGYLTQLGRHGRYRYAPVCSREEATRDLLDDFLGRVGLGRSPSFLIQLLKAEKLSAEDRAALQAILREKDPGGETRPRSRPTDPAAGEEPAP